MHSASEWYHGRPSLPVRSTGRSSDNGSPQAPKSQPVWRARRFSGTTLGATEQTAQRRPKATQRRSDRKPCLEAESKFDLPELVSRASLRAPIDASLRNAQGTSGCSIVEEAAAAPWLFQWVGVLGVLTPGHFRPLQLHGSSNAAALYRRLRFMWTPSECGRALNVDLAKHELSRYAIVGGACTMGARRGAARIARAAARRTCGARPRRAHRRGPPPKGQPLT